MAANAARTTAIRLGIFLIAIGGLVGLDLTFGWDVVPALWPLLLIILAGGLIGIFVKSGRRARVGLAAGTYLVCFGALALVLVFVGWGLLARLWPLFIAFIGVAYLACFGAAGRRRADLLAGLLLICVGVFALFLSFGSQFWWTALVLAGASVLVAELAR